MSEPKKSAATAVQPKAAVQVSPVVPPPAVAPSAAVQPKAAAAGNQRLVTELKVSAHLMAFDAGLFCIFNAPGGPLPDAATGLPGVRVSLPPGPAFRPEAVTINTFRDDGWLGGWNGAALVRVVRGPAQVLVTIYQAPNSAGDAPKLQILRLAEGNALPPLGAPVAAVAPPVPAAAAAPAARPAPAVAAAKAGPAVPASAEAARPTPPGGAPAPAGPAEIMAHVQGRGDIGTALGGWMGEPGSQRWIEGFSISPRHAIGPADIEYQAVLGRGWLSPWAEGGQYCGSRGMSLPILGLRVRLRGEAAERFDCALTTSFIDGTKIGPINNGDPCQAESLAPLEAFRIVVSPKQAAAAAKPAKAKAVSKKAK